MLAGKAIDPGELIPQGRSKDFAAEKALQRADSIGEIMVLRDKAAAVQLFANAQGFKEAAQKAKIFQLKAERKAGSWLDENVERGGNPKLHDVTLDEIDISKQDSSRYQLQAALPEEKFNEWIDESLANGNENPAWLGRGIVLASALQVLGFLLFLPQKHPK
jgi:hypothetical protein